MGSVSSPAESTSEKEEAPETEYFLLMYTWRGVHPSLFLELIFTPALRKFLEECHSLNGLQAASKMVKCSVSFGVWLKKVSFIFHKEIDVIQVVRFQCIM